MVNKEEMYLQKRNELIKKHSKRGRLSLLGKWEVGKLFLHYFPEKDIKRSDYDL